MSKSAANGKVPNGVEKQKQKRQVSFAEAAANISCSDLADFLGKDPRRSGLRTFLDFYSKAFSGITCPWYDMFKPSALTNLFHVIHVPLSHIPDAVYQKSVDWLDQHVSDHMISDFVFSSFRYILNELEGDGDETKDDNAAAIFVAVAMLLRSTPHIYTARLPAVSGDKKILVPVKIWILSQAPQDDLLACLFSWAHYLVPLLDTDPMARHLILCFVERILEKPDAPTILTDSGGCRNIFHGGQSC